MSNLPFSRRSVKEVIIPTNAASTSTTNGSSGAYSAYNQIIASTTNEFLLCGAYVWYAAVQGAATLISGFHQQFIIGKGAAASEVEIAHGGVSFCLSFTSSGAGDQCLFGGADLVRFAPVIVPAGSRLALKSTQLNAVTAGKTSVYLVGYEPNAGGFPLQNPFPLANVYRKGMTTVQANVYPAASETNITTGTPAWTYGSAVQFIASAANDMLITALTLNTNTVQNAVSANVQIGIGAAGSEEWIGQIGSPGLNPFPSFVGRYELLNPIYVKKGEAVSIRGNSSTATKTFGVCLHVDELK